jgi:aspartate-semialdehyde dehydrogenase
MIDHPVRVGIVGATGVVGTELLLILSERGWPVARLALFASDRSAGGEVTWNGASIPLETLHIDAFAEFDIVFFAADAEISRQWAPVARDAGALVIDNSSAFRDAEEVPLVVPEVNGEVLRDVALPAIIANPNCSAIIALMAVAPIHRLAGIERMVISTYQAASGAGAAMMAELEQQAHDYAHGRPLRCDVAGRPFLFNVFCHESPVDDDGMNAEECKLINEAHRLLGDPEIGISATCVRVPVLRAHSEAITLTLRRPVTLDGVRACLRSAEGLEIVDDRAGRRFPEPCNATGRDEVLVGRLRVDPSQPEGIGFSLFVSGDQLRKGAALNAIQIAETVMASAPSIVG